MTLEGKVVVITGAARGMGRAYAHGFLDEGCHVVCGDLSWSGDGSEETQRHRRGGGRTRTRTGHHARRPHRGGVRCDDGALRDSGRAAEQCRDAAEAPHPAARHRQRCWTCRRRTGSACSTSTSSAPSPWSARSCSRCWRSAPEASSTSPPRGRTRAGTGRTAGSSPTWPPRPHSRTSRSTWRMRLRSTTWRSTCSSLRTPPPLAPGSRTSSARSTASWPRVRSPSSPGGGRAARQVLRGADRLNRRHRQSHLCRRLEPGARARRAGRVALRGLRSTSWAGRSITRTDCCTTTPAKAFQGYTLVSMSGGKEAFLIDMEGRVCHRWHSRGRHLLRLPAGATATCSAGRAPAEGSSRPQTCPPASSSWTGTATSYGSYWDPYVHHDFERLPDGHTLMVLYDLMPQDAARRVSAEGAEASRSRCTANWCARWMRPERPYGSGACGRRSTPSRTRSARWRSATSGCTRTRSTSLPSGDLLVSFRQIDTVGIVSRETGRFTWKWGPGEISHQHHPTFLPNGRVLLFDNGPHRGGATYSRVIEVDPESGRIAWEYTGALRSSRSTVTTSAARSGSRTATRSSARERRGGCSR